MYLICILDSSHNMHDAASSGRFFFLAKWLMAEMYEYFAKLRRLISKSYRMNENIRVYSTVRFNEYEQKA